MMRRVLPVLVEGPSNQNEEAPVSDSEYRAVYSYAQWADGPR